MIKKRVPGGKELNKKNSKLSITIATISLKALANEKRLVPSHCSQLFLLYTCFYLCSSWTYSKLHLTWFCYYESGIDYCSALRHQTFLKNVPKEKENFIKSPDPTCFLSYCFARRENSPSSMPESFTGADPRVSLYGSLDAGILGV